MVVNSVPEKRNCLIFIVSFLAEVSTTSRKVAPHFVYTISFGNARDYLLQFLVWFASWLLLFVLLTLVNDILELIYLLIE